MVLRVRPVCEECVAPGRVVSGVRAILRENPRSLAPGLALFLFFAIFVWMSWEMYDVIMAATPSPKYRALLKIGWSLSPLLLYYGLARVFRVQMLVCSKCRRVKKWGIDRGRGLPMQWQEAMIPTFSCSRCGYDLLGLDKARCPECAQEFPTEWLKYTTVGDPSCEVLCEVDGQLM